MFIDVMKDLFLFSYNCSWYNSLSVPSARSRSLFLSCSVFRESLPRWNKEKVFTTQPFSLSYSLMNHNLFTNMQTYFSVLLLFPPDPWHLLEEMHHKPWQIHHWASPKPAHVQPYPSHQLSSWHSGTFVHQKPQIWTCVCRVVLLKSLVGWNLFSRT